MPENSAPPKSALPAPALAMTVAGDILRSTLQGLRHCGFTLLTLAALSFSIHHVLVDVGATVAVHNGPAGIALLVLAITARLALIAVMALVAAHHITLDGKPLLSFDLLAYIVGRDSGHTVDRRWRDHLDAFMLALVPLALLYAGWQLVNADLHQFLLRLNDATLATEDMTNDSNIDFRSGWKYYIPWAAGAWLIKVAFEKLQERTDRRSLYLPIAITEVAWIVLTWLVFAAILGRVQSWWQSREVVDWWRDLMSWLDDVIPTIPVPEIISSVASFVSEALSLIAGELILPVIWVGVAGLVLGWGSREAATVEGSRLQPMAERRWNAASKRNRYLADLFTRELREKYLPVVAMGRLLWRIGLIPLLTIAAMYAVGGVAGSWFEVTIANAVDTDGNLSLIPYESVQRLVAFALEPIRICFLVATFAMVLRLRHAVVAPARATA